MMYKKNGKKEIKNEPSLFEIQEPPDLKNLAQSLSKIYLTKRINMISTRSIYASYQRLFAFNEQDLLSQGMRCLDDRSLEALLLLVRQSFTHNASLVEPFFSFSRYKILRKMHKQVVVSKLNGKLVFKKIVGDLFCGRTLDVLLLLYKLRKRISNVVFVKSLYTQMKKFIENDFEICIRGKTQNVILLEQEYTKSGQFHKKIKQYLENRAKRIPQKPISKIFENVSILEILGRQINKAKPPNPIFRKATSLNANPLLSSFLGYYILQKLDRTLRLKNEDFFRLSEQFFSLTVLLVKKLSQSALEKYALQKDSRGKSFFDYMFKGGKPELVNLHFIQNKIGEFWQPLESFDLVLDYNSHLHRLKKTPTFRIKEFFQLVLDPKLVTRSEWQFSVFESSLKIRIFFQIFNTSCFVVNEVAFTQVQDQLVGQLKRPGSEWLRQESIWKGLFHTSFAPILIILILRVLFSIQNASHFMFITPAKNTRPWISSKILIIGYFFAHSWLLFKPSQSLTFQPFLWTNFSALGVYLGIFQLYHLMVNLKTIGKLLQIIVSLIKVT